MNNPIQTVARWKPVMGLLILLGSSLLAAATSQDNVDVLLSTAEMIDVETRLSMLRRELSIAVLADASDPGLAELAALRLRHQGLSLWAAVPSDQERKLVLDRMQQWGLLARLPGWNPMAALPQLARPELPGAPNKAELEARTDFDNLSQPLVVHFWAHWCRPCREELPQLARFYAEQYLALQAAGIALVTVNNDPILNPADTSNLSVRVRQLPVLHDPDFRLYRQLAQTHGVALPATFFVQPNQPAQVLAYGPMEWLAPGVTRQLEALVYQP